MLRTQISLTAEERRLLDAEAARTGRSISALIRDAVNAAYGTQQNATADRRAIQAALGAWQRRGVDGAAYVEQVRSGGRLHDASAQ
jgi:hypothetical protein